MQRPTREELLELIPSGEIDRPAVVRGLSLIPDWKLNEYFGKLKADSQQPGTVHELRVLGKLAMRRVRGFGIAPCNRGEHFDALLTIDGVEVELEITAHVKPAYKAAIDRVCKKIEGLLTDRFPGRSYEVRLGNMGGGFVNKAGADGVEHLDEDATLRECIHQLEEAIGPQGKVGPAWAKDRFQGPVTSVRPSRVNHVWQKSYQMPGDADVEQVRRKVSSKVDKAQWTGKRPALLAVVLAHDPDVDLLDQRSPNVADEAFAKASCLAAVVGLPFCNFLSSPKAIFPADPHGLADIGEAGRLILTRAFRFWLGVDWRWALVWYRDMRQNMEKDGTWPGWSVIRFGKS